MLPLPMLRPSELGLQRPGQKRCLLPMREGRAQGCRLPGRSCVLPLRKGERSREAQAYLWVWLLPGISRRTVKSRAMTTVLQGNMNRSRTAHDLLTQICSEKSVDVVLISEQYRSRDDSGWYADSLGTAAIWIPDPRRFCVARHGSGRGFVWVQCRCRNGATTYVSCYFTPNEAVGGFQAKLQGLEDVVREMEGELIVAGDFNAKAIEWGMPSSDSRGRSVVEMMSRLGLIVLNDGQTSTFRRPGYRQTIIDITLAAENLAPRVHGWRVMEDYTGSDHQYITFCVRDVARQPERISVRGPPRWNVDRLDKEKLSLALERGQRTLSENTDGLSPSERAIAVSEATMRLIQRACEEAMPRKRLGGSRRPAYWWTNEIAEHRRQCLKLRRLAQRARTRVDANSRMADYKSAKRALRRSIKASQRRCWKALGDDLNGDPWGLGYKIVTRKLGAFKKEAPGDAETIDRIVDALFPTHPKRIDRLEQTEVTGAPPFTEAELRSAVSSMRNKKAPGLDGIPAEVFKAIVESHPHILLEMYNCCLAAGIFYSRWKEAKLVLISKGKGSVDAPSSYRPLCMLDTAGKLLEKLLRPRLHEAVVAAGDLADRQYGFRKGRSTVHAIRDVVEAARATESGNHHSRPVCLLALLDVKNAFNSVSWSNALEAMRRDFGVPLYILRMMSDYLKDRFLVYETSDGAKRRELTAGAAQGSVMGSDIWNVQYDGIFRMEMPEGTFLVGYADDVAACITARNVEQAQMRLNQVMRRVTVWLEDHGLELAATKTEIVLLTKRHIPTVRPMQVGDVTVETKAAARYLGVMLDTKLTFRHHINKAADRAASITASLSRIMANVGGPRPCKRRLLMRTAESVMLYGAEVWADALRVERNRRRMAAVQRMGALRIASSYRTVSESAVLVIADVIPIDLQAAERKLVHQTIGAFGKLEAAERARAATMQAWQARWEQDPRGRWTARLIPQIEPWYTRPHGEVNYHLTQLLSGHGRFRAYLHRMGKVPDPGCVHCSSSRDDVIHTFFQCERWRPERESLEESIGPIGPDNIVRLMMADKESWARVDGYVRSILREKRRVEEGW